MRLLLALVLALAGAATIAAGVARAEPADPLVAFARQKAAVIELLQTRASRAVATAARDRFILDYLVAAREDVRALLKTKIDRQLVGIQTGLSVDEICLIGHDGREFSRVVRGEIATDLSPDESGAVFFAPTWQIGGGEPYVSAVYRSPDTHEWVISYSTPVGGVGEQDALLHLEQNLRRLLTLIAIRPAPVGVHWYVIEDQARTLFDSASGTARLLGPVSTDDPAAFFEPIALEPSVLAIVAQRTRMGHSTRVNLGDQTYDAAASGHGRWIVLAVKVVDT